MAVHDSDGKCEAQDECLVYQSMQKVFFYYYYYLLCHNCFLVLIKINIIQPN